MLVAETAAMAGLSAAGKVNDVVSTVQEVPSQCRTVATGGLKLTAGQLFDLSIIEGIYKDHPELI